MTLGDIATKARSLTHTDVSSYTDANLLIDVNLVYQKVADIIFQSQDDSDFDDIRTGAGGSAGSSASYPVQTTPMIANQRDYFMGVSERMLKLKRVDITYNGTNWYRAEPFDTGAFPYGIGFTNSSPVDATFDSNFIKENPRYDFAYNSIWVIPMPVAADVAAGGLIRTEWFRNVIAFTSADWSAVMTDSTQVPGFDAPFHPMLSLGAAIEFGTSANLPQVPLWTQQWADWETRLRGAYGRKDLDTRLTLGAESEFRNSYR